MEIWVEFDSHSSKFRISPEPAYVKRGSPVSWRFRADNLSDSARIRWNVYFNDGTPFGVKTAILSTLSGQIAGQHVAATGIVFADETGDYKYGVRAVDLSSGKTLGDDDPTLKVSD
jgi:hypothetical protein